MFVYVHASVKDSKQVFLARPRILIQALCEQIDVPSLD